MQSDFLFELNFNHSEQVVSEKNYAAFCFLHLSFSVKKIIAQKKSAIKWLHLSTEKKDREHLSRGQKSEIVIWPKLFFLKRRHFYEQSIVASMPSNWSEAEAAFKATTPCM